MDAVAEMLKGIDGIKVETKREDKEPPRPPGDEGEILVVWNPGVYVALPPTEILPTLGFPSSLTSRVLRCHFAP